MSFFTYLLFSSSFIQFNFLSQLFVTLENHRVVLTFLLIVRSFQFVRRRTLNLLYAESIIYIFDRTNSPKAEWTAANSKQNIILSEAMLVTTSLSFFPKSRLLHLTQTRVDWSRQQTRLSANNAQYNRDVVYITDYTQARPMWRERIFARIKISTLHLGRSSVYWKLQSFMRALFPLLLAPDVHVPLPSTLQPSNPSFPSLPHSLPFAVIGRL